jgi:hypothetical protein
MTYRFSCSQINIQDGKYDSMDDLDPTISWQTKTTKGEYDFEVSLSVVHNVHYLACACPVKDSGFVCFVSFLTIVT